jgi:hypothetical protein
MNNDAEAQEVHATVTDSEEPANGYRNEPVAEDQNGPVDRPDRADEDDDDDEVIDPDEVILAEDAGESGDVDDLDDLDDNTHPDTVVASAIVVEPAAADDTVADPATADDTVADPATADDTVTDPATGADTVAEPVAATEPVPGFSPAGPKHAVDAVPARPGMPVNGDVPKGSPMAGDPDQLHERWAAIQSTFVDDPRGSVTSAADMMTEVIATIVASAAERESGLRAEWDRDGVDTEGLRTALRSYRSLLDQLAAL